MQDDIALRLTPQEINLVLEALGNMPFVRVYGLIGKIQSQAAAAMEQTPAAAPAPGGGN
ncbi:MAG: hypothetical protein KF778_03960 [Rhodocyclaceae bacterium]|nr:hypothetical protein [Rhodocyclaceae bacterium]MBX3667535.1 hypothetical protein [Rhodocyclaceae bacterium]